MKKIFLLLFFCSSILSAQDLKNKLAEANTAIASEKYTKAIKIYKKLIKQNKSNSGLRIDLANVYFKTNEVDNACECLYEAAALSNAKALGMANEKCKSYKSGKVKLFAEIDQPSMFLYNGTYHNLIENNAVNPLYRKSIYEAMFGTTYLSAYPFTDISIDVKIDANGNFVGEVLGFRGMNAERKMVKDGLEEILRRRIVYKPALYNQTAVEIFEKFRLEMN